MKRDQFQEEEDDQEEQLDEEEIVQAILELGNDILRNLGVEERIDDVGVFFSDAFYIQFFEAAFPEIDFNQLEEATNESEMAQNIQALIDLLGQQILKYDLSHIRGEEIVNGNPEHCINLLQLVQEISVMLQNKTEGADGPEGSHSEEESEEEQHQEVNRSQKQNQQRQQQFQEDDEAQVIHEKKKKQQEQTSGQQKQQQNKSSTSQKQSNQKRGRSHSDDRGKPQFEMDEFDISNDFDVQMDNDQEEDEDDFHQQLQQQKQQIENLKGNNQNQEDHGDDEGDEHSYNEEIDENDLKMYEQFLANNKQSEQQLAMMGQQPNAAPGPNGMHQEDEEDDGEFDSEELENIDYNQLDPQILEIAEQMGVHPKEVLKQFLQLQSQGGNGEDEDEGEDFNGEGEEDDEQQFLMEEQLRKEKELFKQQMGLQNKQNQQQQQQQQQKQAQQKQPEAQYQSSSKKQAQQQQQKYQYEDDEDDEESYYSEGEIKTRIKLISQKSYSAPYIIINDCFDEPLYDSESQILQKACSTTMLQSLELQEQMADGDGMEGEEIDEQTAQLLYQHQQKMMKQQQMNQQQQQQPSQKKENHNSKITEVSKSKESSSITAQQQKQQQQMKNDKKDQYGMKNNKFVQDEDEEEMDIDVSQKLQELQKKKEDQKNSNQMNRQQVGADEYGQEGDEDEDDEDMLIDLDNLDDQNRQMLLEYLHQEYEKNPDQFPFPKELIQDYMLKKQQQSADQEMESIKDIKSEEMIVEDANNHQQDDYIEGGEQEVEGEDQEEEELTDEQQKQLQQLLQQQMMQEQMQDYGDEGQEDEDQANFMQPQFQQQQLQQQMMLQQQQQKPKNKRPRTAGKKKKAVGQQNQMHQQQIPEDQLQQLAQILQEQQIDIENVDPNLLQQMIMAQSHQQQQMMNERQSRPTTAKKRKSSATKKKSTLKQNQKLLPYQMPKQMKVLMPGTPGSHFKSFNTQRSQGLTKKKPLKKKSAKKQKMGVNAMNQNQQIQNIQEALYQQQLQQQQQQQQQHQTDENQDEDEGQQQQQQQDFLQPIQLADIPNLSEDFLNQLSEEQLEQLLQHQQHLMQMQQQQQQQIVMMNNQQQLSAKKTRPKSAKTTKSLKSNKIPQTYSNYYQPNADKKRKSAKGKKGKKKKTTIPQGASAGQGVMLNNYFPALEQRYMVQPSSTDDGSQTKDQKYPKFGTENINNPQYGLQQDQIDEVPPEQEEGESQENIQRQPNFYQVSNQNQQTHTQQDDENEDEDDENHNQDQDVIGQENMGDQDEADPHEEQIELSDEQLIDLIQNAHNLSPEQQVQLQMILQQRMKHDIMNERAQSYQDIYQILIDNVKKAKEKLAPLGQVGSRSGDAEETDRRIIRQKQEFEALYKQYIGELKNKEQKKRYEDTKLEKKLQRESKIQTIKERKFQDELQAHQKSLSYKRNAQQVKLCQKVYKLASELEKNKLLTEKKEFKENFEKKKTQSKLMVDAIETYYKNQISMLKEKIHNERFERQIAQKAQQEALAKMKRELNNQKKLEVERYLQLLRQEDQKYDFESTNLQRLEHEIVRMYKK